MNTAAALIAGAFFGILGCAAPAFLFERALKTGTRVSMAAGLASVLSSFLLESVVLLVAYRAMRSSFLEFGCAMVGSFLLFWGVESVRAWRAANGRS